MKRVSKEQSWKKRNDPYAGTNDSRNHPVREFEYLTEERSMRRSGILLKRNSRKDWLKAIIERRCNDVLAEFGLL
jgi:hypothetical protein